MTTENRRNSKSNRNPVLIPDGAACQCAMNQFKVQSAEAQFSSAFRRVHVAKCCAARIKIDITVVHRYALIYAHSVKSGFLFLVEMS